jgi:hypothetical protein
VEPVAVGLGAQHQRRALNQEQQRLGLRLRCNCCRDFPAGLSASERDGHDLDESS